MLIELISLFFISFLAGSFIPLSSEAYLIYLSQKNNEHLLLVLVAGLGNTLGGISCYAIARYGGIPLIEKYLKISPARIHSWHIKMEKKSEWVAIFCWLPVVGEVIAAVLGLISNKLFRISVYMFVGKMFRYYILLRGFEGLLNLY